MSDNPYLDSVPEELSKADFVQQIKSTPDFAGVPMTNRIAKLGELFVPMDYMYTVYDLLLHAIRTTYLTITMLDTIRQIQGLRQESVSSFATEAESGSSLGVPRRRQKLHCPAVLVPHSPARDPQRIQRQAFLQKTDPASVC